MLVVMLVVVAAAVTIIIVMMMLVVMLIVMLMIMMHSLNYSFKSIFSFNCTNKCFRFQFTYRSSDNYSRAVFLSDKLNCIFKLFFLYGICVAHNNRACVLYLIIEKFTEILHIHFALSGINNSCKCIENDILICNALNSFNNI